MDGHVETLDRFLDEENQQLRLDMNGGDYREDFKRGYLKTHPWLTFKLDLRNAPPKLWLLLGEAKSKCEALARAPLPPTMADHLHRLFLVKGVHGTTAIEGNTLTEEQVRRIVEGRRLELPPSQAYLEQEVDNIVVACNALATRAVENRFPTLSPRLIRSFNKTVLNKLELPDGVRAGEIRDYEVGVARYLAAPHKDCPYLVARLCEWLDDLRQGSKSMEEKMIRAILAHLYLAWIHPFGDGNGRTARLMEFQILINGGIPTAAAHLMSNHYNRTRSRYLRELDAASRSGGDVIPFLIYAMEGFVEQLREQIEVVAEYQIRLSWRDYIHELFRERKSPPELRRRDLLLELSWLPEPAPQQKIRTISPAIESAYRDRTDKTITRDLNWLIKKGFLERSAGGYSARTDIIFGFLPVRKKREPEKEKPKAKGKKA